jgi:uncharacterized protein (DUF488 family)
MISTIWTIGHSTLSIEKFLALLRAFEIEVLMDIRSFPGSRKYPHFNKPVLEQVLQDSGVGYAHIPELGGRRKPRANSQNTVWRNEAFRGYADYMETEPFRDAISRLEEIAKNQRVAYMCSEAVWWRCHRALVSDYLKAKGWTVMHIMGEGKSSEHPFTKPAREAQGRLFDD